MLHLVMCQFMELLVTLFLSTEVVMMPLTLSREVFQEFLERIIPSMLRSLKLPESCQK